jgi:tetratricopeptide (TPR) repeat protein
LSPEDRQIAREALARKKLTIDQVGELQKECEATGKPFAQAAIGRGFLRLSDIRDLQALPAAPAPVPEPPAPPSPSPAPAGRPIPPALYPVLIGAVLVLLVPLTVSSIRQLYQRRQDDPRTAAETMANLADAERKARETRIEYDQRRVAEREARARASLEKARSLMKRVTDLRSQGKGEAEIYTPLLEAAIAFGAYLEIHPEDADALVERADAHALARLYERAVQDLERAISIRKELEPSLRDRLTMLRLLLPKR